MRDQLSNDGVRRRLRHRRRAELSSQWPAVVTTVGLDHKSAFRTCEAVAAEKRKLVERLPSAPKADILGQQFAKSVQEIRFRRVVIALFDENREVLDSTRSYSLSTTCFG